MSRRRKTLTFDRIIQKEWITPYEWPSSLILHGAQVEFSKGITSPELGYRFWDDGREKVFLKATPKDPLPFFFPPTPGHTIGRESTVEAIGPCIRDFNNNREHQDEILDEKQDHSSTLCNPNKKKVNLNESLMVFTYKASYRISCNISFQIVYGARS